MDFFEIYSEQLKFEKFFVCLFVQENLLRFSLDWLQIRFVWISRQLRLKF